MILFRSPLTMGLLTAALILSIGGALSKKGRVLSFLGAMCCAVSVVTGLVEGAVLQETMLYVLPVLGASCAGDMLSERKEKRG